MSGKFVVGIDGGHRNATAVVVAKNNPRIPTVVRFVGLDAINHHYLSPDDCVCRYVATLGQIGQYYQAAPDVFVDTIEKIVLSVPGAIPEAIEGGKLYRKLRGAHKNLSISVVDDTWAGMFVETGEPRGICAFAGTGASVSIASKGFSSDKSMKIDGWGHIIGDHGSGFQVASDFFRKLGRDFDLGIKSGFYESLRQYCDPKENRSSRLKCLPEDHGLVQAWFDELKDTHEREWLVRFAELAKPCLQYVDKNPSDLSALAIAEKAANDFLETIRIAIGRSNQMGLVLPLILQGEMFQSKFYRESVVNKALEWRERELVTDVRVAINGPEHGAVKIAMHSIGMQLDDYERLPSVTVNVRDI